MTNITQRPSVIKGFIQGHNLLLTLLLPNIVALLCQKCCATGRTMCGCAMLLKFSNILWCFSDVLKGGRRR